MRLQRSLLLALVLIAASAAVGVWAWRMLPADSLIATHFGVSGQPNGFMAKGPGLAVAPVVGLIAVIVLALAPRWSRGGQALAGSGAYGILQIGVAAMFLVVEAALAVHALDPSFDAMRWVFVAVGVLFVVIGAVLGRIPPNRVAGIRTPWTLADPAVWTRTHRFTGRLLTLGGVALAGVATLGADHIDLYVALLVCILGPALAGVIYSRAIAKPAAGG